MFKYLKAYTKTKEQKQKLSVQKDKKIKRFSIF